MTLDYQSQLSPAMANLLPSCSDVAFYREHGWFVAPQVLDDDLIDEALVGAEQFYRGERDSELPQTGGFRDWKEQDGGPLRNSEFVSLQNHRIARLIREPIVGAIAAKLAETSQIRLLDDQLVYKTPNSPASATVGWHADHAYWGTCSSDNMLTAWIPFHDVDELRAPLVVLDKSHRWTGLEHTRFFNNPDLDEVEVMLRAQGHTIERIPLSLKKGQISFHHGWTLHASYPNRSDSPRIALAVHLQDFGNAYRPYWSTDGKEVHIADEAFCRRLPNGDPDFSDPDVFPVLWQEA
ncbi:MAG: phytanoyl-CoA dioxygenase family protein [Planctomycetales bacterium]|nr:phytanoyl-CoA dioxygenase family protein [Planctomycetales bacterium]